METTVKLGPLRMTFNQPLESASAGERAPILCSIAIPTYNREDLVRGAIESALASTRQDIEVLVIDNCSEDRTVEVARSYDDPRLRVVVNDSNLGLFGNFNRCIELSVGKYVCILCSDDRVRPDFLDKAIAAMELHPECGLLNTRAQFIDLDGRPLRQTADHLEEGVYKGEDAIYNFVWFHAHYAFTTFNVPSGMLIRRDTVQGMEWFPTRMKIVGDAEFFTRILERSDLLSLTMVGCEETFHPGQEVFKIYDDPARVHEHFEILDRYRPILGRSYKRCLAAECAVNVALAVKFRKLGNRKTAEEHWRIVRSKDVSLPVLYWACARLVVYRLLFKFFQVRFMPRGVAQ